MAQRELLDALLVGKPEIAALARVRRPVVTMWIARHRGKAAPFPRPVAGSGDRELFRGAEVIDWISAHGLGNNPDLQEDLAVHAVLHGPGTDEASPRERLSRSGAIAVLLALRAELGEPLSGRSAAELISEAGRIDPDDRLVASEVAGLRRDLPELAGQVDLLCDAAYGPAAAFAAVVRRSTGHAPDARAPLANRAPALVGALGAALLVDCPAPQVLDGDPTDGTLLLAIHDRLPEHATFRPILPEGKEQATRFARRHLVVNGLRAAPPGGDVVAGGAPDLVVARLPGLPAGTSPTQALERLAAHVEAVPNVPAIVIGPAGALTDAIADPAADATRWDLLRADRVRSVVRLPEGLVPSRPGVALALWVLGPPRGLAADDRWMTIADLSPVDLDDVVIEDLVTDVLASLGTYAEANLHAFRFARIVRTASVIARGAMLPVPPPTVAPGRTVGAADTAVTIQLAADAIGERRLAPPPGLRVQAATSPRARLVPAGRLAADRALRVVPGSRIDPADLDAGGAVTVIGPEEIHGRTRIGARRLDRLAFSTRYPRARYTEPGDVLFCTTPHPGAVVDAEGSHAVLAPARILRISDPAVSGLVPELVAGQLRRLVPDRKPAGSIRATAGWRTWLLPVLDREDAARVAAALSELDAHRRELAEHLADVEDLRQSLTAYLADGVVTVEPAPAPAGRAPRRTGTR